MGTERDQMITNKIDELVQLIQKQNFEGTEEEIAIQQVFFLDQYIKQNIEYDFETYEAGKKAKEILTSDKTTPNDKIAAEDSLSKMSGFQMESFFLGKSLCGVISEVAKLTLNKLWSIDKTIKISCACIYASFAGDEANHMLNVIHINDKTYRVDFTLSMLANHFWDLREDYINAMKEMNFEEPDSEFEYLFSDKLLEKEKLGGVITYNSGRQETITYNEQHDTLDRGYLSKIFSEMNDKIKNNQEALRNTEKEEQKKIQLEEMLYNDEKSIEEENEKMRKF